MSQYFYALLITSVCGAVCALMAWGGFEKYIKYIASLICVLVMISPFRGLDFTSIESIGEISVPEADSAPALYKTAANLTETDTEEYISQIVFGKFGIKPTAVNINIDWEQEIPTIESIVVMLSKEDSGYSSQIKDYLFDVLGGEVTVIEG